MFIGLLQIEVRMDIHSLKEKRMIVKSFKERVRHKFNVAVSETGFADKWQRAELSFVVVGNDKMVLEKNLNRILSLADENYKWSVNGFHIDFY
jgi:uncharacterized protein YlxP (DUF503 family)